MKTRVVQLITFEIESSYLAGHLTEEVADRICAAAAQDLRFDVGDGIHAALDSHIGDTEAGITIVRVAKVSADDLTYILIDRRRLHAENVRLHAQREVLRAFIEANYPKPEQTEALYIAEALNLKPNEDPEETQGGDFRS